MTQKHLDVFNHGYDDAERGHPFDGGPYVGLEADQYRHGYNTAKQEEAQAYRIDTARDRITENEINQSQGAERG